jgi:hypothetical protein
VKLEDMIFVFGSNLDGIHGAGAARYAAVHRGAEYGIGEGLTGSAYALPTKGHNLSYMDLKTIRGHVDNFLHFAFNNPHMTFQVTQVGCGLSGWLPQDIAPMFIGITNEGSNCLFDTKWRSYLQNSALFWGTG